MSGRSVKPRPHTTCREKGIKKAARLAQKTNLERYTGAIAFFDLPRSTEIMKCDTIKAIRAMLRHNAVCRAVIEPNGGEIIKELGDGVMAGFIGAGTAVECAIKVIKCLQEHGDGMHTKAVVASGTLWSAKNSSGVPDVYGTPVNVSARMSEHAVKDAVLVDGKDKESAVEWLAQTAFRVRPSQKQLRNYKGRKMYVISPE